ncbi:MAG: SDR family NAD(P)-dependent oxidoreductase [Spirochaetia bacterium]|nr:SDR family NAD(P)-dependent oxidoreductase [Spirochaetia bacterium]
MANLSSFAKKYGPWAAVAGASEGLGAAFAEALASRKINLILLARREAMLAGLAESLQKKHGVEIRTAICDLADPGFPEVLKKASAGIEVGLGIYNAAYSFIGPLLDKPLESALRVVDVNIRGPLYFLHTLGPAMKERGRGGLVLMSSIAGFQGSPRLATYAASKAFNIVLGESLWSELKSHGVDVLVTCAGAIRTPNYNATQTGEAPGTLEPSAVAEKTLRSLGKGPIAVPGFVNQLARFFLGRLLSRRGAVGVMDRSTKGLQ